MHQRHTLQHCSSPICGCQGESFDCANPPMHCLWNSLCWLAPGMLWQAQLCFEDLQAIAFEPRMLPDAFRATHAVRATVPCL